MCATLPLSVQPASAVVESSATIVLLCGYHTYKLAKVTKQVTLFTTNREYQLPEGEGAALIYPLEDSILSIHSKGCAICEEKRDLGKFLIMYDHDNQLLAELDS